MPENLPPEWRGRVNMMLYGLNLRTRPGDDVLDRRVERLLIHQRSGHDPEEYYRAAVAALRSGAALATDEEQDEGAVRDALTGIVRRLDARRPWPPPPFVEQDVRSWDELRAAPVIGRIPLPLMDVEARLVLPARSLGPGRGEVLIVKLRSGRSVALRAAGVFGAPTVELLSSSEPMSTRAEFAEATGLGVEPI